MCGFVGLLFNMPLSTEEETALDKMSCALAHRGPDSAEKYVHENAALAFRRLSIIDLENGTQPYSGFDGAYTIVYNGEIYNYLELRETLIAKGYEFTTHSEVEVLLALYHEHGTAFLTELRGMFAFIIYDKKAGTFFGARDPFGIKPFYYRLSDKGLICASEMKAFQFEPTRSVFEVDAAALQQYLTFQYVPELDTIDTHVKVLPAGHYFVYSPAARGLSDSNGEDSSPLTQNNSANAALSPIEYAPLRLAPNPSISFDEKAKRIREALESSVRYHMISDVPVGTFLSSGIDSAVITALASKLAPGIKAFTVSFDVKGYSEVDDAADIAEHLDVEHIKLMGTVDDFVAAYEQTIYHLDTPVADPSVVSIYMIAREAAKHVKVVLSGEGSDELFGGYLMYGTSVSAQKLHRLPRPLRSVLGALSHALPEGVKGKNLLNRGGSPLEDWFVGGSFNFTEEEKQRFMHGFNPNQSYQQITRPLLDEVRGETLLTQMQHLDLQTWLRGDILVKGDRLSMAHALEVRVPFLDKEVFEAARILIDSDKLAEGTTKYALRYAMKDLVNPETFMRKKLGYPTPVRVWLKDELYDWARAIIQNSNADEWINRAAALELLEQNRRGTVDYYKRIWTLLTFLTWHKLYIEEAEQTKARALEGF